MAVDRLPSGSFRARLMIDGQRYTATLPTEADARVWELETRAAAAVRSGAASVTFAAYATGWLAEFIDDAPDRARFEAALEHWLLPVLGELALLEVVGADTSELSHRVMWAGVDMDGRSAWECLREILENVAENLRTEALAAVAEI